MQAGDIKALIAALALPPAGPLLLVLLGLLLAWRGRRWGLGLALLAGAGLAALCSHAVAIALAHALLPPTPAVGLADLRRARVQAVVVLGGGVLPQAPEYGEPQPGSATLDRLRYGVRLARQAGLPLGFAGGVGWAGRGPASEGQAARASARQDFGQDIRWLDDRSRDTRENAQLMAALLRRDGVRRIALVTDALHLPRSVLEFQRAGLEVLPAPTRLPAPTDKPAIEALPSAAGLALSRHVLREWLALQLARHSGP